MKWRAYLHRLAMGVLVEARDAFARDRRRLNVVNYVDLLRVTERMLRDAATCAARSSGSTAGCSSTSSRTPTPSRRRSS